MIAILVEHASYYTVFQHCSAQSNKAFVLQTHYASDWAHCRDVP